MKNIEIADVIIAAKAKRGAEKGKVCIMGLDQLVTIFMDRVTAEQEEGKCSTTAMAMLFSYGLTKEARETTGYTIPEELNTHEYQDAYAAWTSRERKTRDGVALKAVKDLAGAMSLKQFAPDALPAYLAKIEDEDIRSYVEDKLAEA